MAPAELREPTAPIAAEFTAAEIGALAHLYRGEVYRSTVWRTRLDSSTNWAVVTTGIALSATYSNAEASPLPMVLVGLLVSVFLLFEARRYRYFNVWRARARLLETDFYAPMLSDEGARRGSERASCSPKTIATRTITSVTLVRLGADFAEHTVDISCPGHCILWQACHPSFAADYARRGLATSRHRPNRRRVGRCGRKSILFELDAVRACHLSNRGRLTASAAKV